MLPKIKLGNKLITVENISGENIDYQKVVSNLKSFAGFKLYVVALASGVSYTRIQKASSGHGVRFSDCEKLALLDLHNEHCQGIKL